MFKVKLLILILLLMIFPSGCSLFSNPKTILLNYWKAIENNNYAKAYTYLSSEDKSVKSLEEFSVRSDFDAFNQFVNKNTTRKISKVEINNDVAVVTVEISEPDFRALWDILTTEEFDDKSEIEKLTLLESKYISKIPKITSLNYVILVKENNEWKVFIGYAGIKKAAEEEQAKKEKLLAEVKPYIKILSSKATVYDDHTFIKGNIKNTYSKKIDSIELICYFLDSTGNPFFEDDAFCFDIKPNYVSKFIFMVNTENLPNWNRKFKIEVKDVRIKE